MSPAPEQTPGLFKPRINSKAHPKVTNEDILAFFQQLSVMFRAGTPIYEAIQISGTQCQSTKLQGIIENRPPYDGGRCPNLEPLDGDVCPGRLRPPRAVPGLAEVITIAAGGNHGCAWDVSDRLWCWGQTGWGAIGTGTPSNAPTAPVVVPLP